MGLCLVACRVTEPPATRVILPSVASAQWAAPASTKATEPAPAKAPTDSASADAPGAVTEVAARFARVELVRFATRLSRDLPLIANAQRSVLAQDGTRPVRPGSLWFGEAHHSVPDALWTTSPASAIWQGLVAWRGAEELQLNLEGPSDLVHNATVRLLIDVQADAREQHWIVRVRVRGPAPDPQQALADDESLASKLDEFVKPRAEELLLLPMRATPEQALTLLLPSPFDDAWLGLRLSPATPSAAAAAHALAARDERLSARAFVRPAPQGAGLIAVVDAGLQRRETRRATLQGAATRAKLPLVAELCLVAPDVLLDAMARATQTRLREGATLGMRSLLGGTLDALSQTPLPEHDATRVNAVLREHLGALDKRRDLLSEALPSFVNENALESFLRRENMLLLEDNRASARLRAFEWLHRRGLAPEGYDPLATSAERRAALQRAADLQA
ncbi:MAG: hypothetical protein DHS20C15_25450 [Planctomycetota bacterium]|nr:MAG: hypothetical protein DHS20C15_25450 [Planctomycetota bacterium]